MEDINYGKLPQLYDKYVKEGYSKSFKDFIEEVLNSVVTNHHLIKIKDKNISIDSDVNLQTLIQIEKYFNSLNELETELNIYNNEEFISLKESLLYLSDWFKKNKIQIKNLHQINTYSELYKTLIPLSTFFNYDY